MSKKRANYQKKTSVKASLQPPRYNVKHKANMLEISGEARNTVQLEFTGRCFRTWRNQEHRDFGLFDYGAMISWLSREAIEGWERPANKSLPAQTEDVSETEYTDRWIPQWIRDIGVRAFNAKVYPYWKDWISATQPEVVSVHKAVHAAIGSSIMSPILGTDELYKNEFIIGDIIRYPAAAMAAGWLDGMTLHQPWVQAKYPFAAERLKAKLRFELCRDDAERTKLYFAAIGTSEQNVPMWLDFLSHWPSVFAFEGAPYRSLNRTLMNMPRQIPLFLLTRFPHIRLERPIIDRAELLLILAYALYPEAPNRHIIMHAHHEDIISMLDVVTRSTNAYFPWRKGSTYRRIASLLSSYPNSYDGNVVGLARRAIRHREELQYQRLLQRTLSQYHPDVHVAKPPVALPSQNNISFLEKVGDITNESAQMKHCVAAYADKAVRGDCYLFHVEYASDKATVEVNRYGMVVQAKGPHNIANEACKWGETVLANWGKQFPVIEVPADNTDVLPF